MDALALLSDEDDDDEIDDEEDEGANSTEAWCFCRVFTVYLNNANKKTPEVSIWLAREGESWLWQFAALATKSILGSLSIWVLTEKGFFEKQTNATVSTLANYQNHAMFLVRESFFLA